MIGGRGLAALFPIAMIEAPCLKFFMEQVEVDSQTPRGQADDASGEATLTDPPPDRLPAHAQQLGDLGDPDKGHGMIIPFLI